VKKEREWMGLGIVARTSSSSTDETSHMKKGGLTQKIPEKDSLNM